MPDTIETHPTPWQDVVLACRKCGKKLGNKGFGAARGDTFPRAVRTELRQEGRRREVRVVETKCLGLCPKQAVSVVLARDPGRILAVPPGTAPRAVLDRLGLLRA